MPLTEDFYLKRNDTREALEVIAEEEDENGVAQTLPVPATTIVRFHMVQADVNEFTGLPMPSPGAVKVDAVGYVIPAVPGGIGYQWITADTTLAGSFLFEFQLTFLDGRILTFPNRGNGKLHIEADLV